MLGRHPGAFDMAKRKLEPVEKIAVKVDRELTEKEQHPDRIAVVRVLDETDDNENPRTFVVLKSPGSEPSR
jgi:hypothetical protein